MNSSEAVSMVAVMPYQFAVTALVGPIAATAEQAGDLLVILRDRGFLEKFPSFGIRAEYRVRKTACGYEEAKDQPKDFYIVGSVPTALVTRARRELGIALKRATGQPTCFSRVSPAMLRVVKH